MGFLDTCNKIRWINIKHILDIMIFDDAFIHADDAFIHADDAFI